MEIQVIAWLVEQFNSSGQGEWLSGALMLLAAAFIACLMFGTPRRPDRD